MPENSKKSKSPSAEKHRAQSPQTVRCFVLTVSDTRTLETDEGGALLVSLLESAGHVVVNRQVVKDSAGAIESTVRAAVYHRDEPEAIIVTGGSGIGPCDVTPEALRPLLTKELPGFGEIFRMLSWQEIGGAAMLSRAFAGLLGRTLLFALPGSPHAIQLAMDKLILPELGHLVREVRPERSRADASK